MPALTTVSPIPTPVPTPAPAGRPSAATGGGDRFADVLHARARREAPAAEGARTGAASVGADNGSDRAGSVSPDGTQGSSSTEHEAPGLAVDSATPPVTVVAVTTEAASDAPVTAPTSAAVAVAVGPAVGAPHPAPVQPAGQQPCPTAAGAPGAIGGAVPAASTAPSTPGVAVWATTQDPIAAAAVGADSGQPGDAEAAAPGPSASRARPTGPVAGSTVIEPRPAALPDLGRAAPPAVEPGATSAVSTTSAAATTSADATASTAPGDDPTPGATAQPSGPPVSAIPAIPAGATPAAALPTARTAGPLPALPVPAQVVAAVSPLVTGLDGSHQVMVHLQPEHLGAVHVQLTVTGDQVTLRLAAGDAATRDTLRQGLPELRVQLEQSGLRPGDIDVQTAAPDLSGRETGADPRGGRPAPSGPGARPGHGPAVVAATPDPRPTAPSDALVDVRM